MRPTYTTSTQGGVAASSSSAAGSDAQAPQLHIQQQQQQYSSNSNSGAQYDRGGGDASEGDNPNAAGEAGGKDESGRPPYTMHGVLHYLQHEWSRYELERAQWEMERAELRARISFLVGERKGQENLKHDLVRRIKMLEWSLRQERAKNHRLTHNGQEPEAEELDEQLINAARESNVPLDIDLVDKDAMGKGLNAQAWQEARQLLRQYLQEIGYSEKALDIRSFRVRSLLGLAPDNNWNNAADGRKAAERALLDSEQAVLDTADVIKQSRRHDTYQQQEDSDSDNSDGDKGLDTDAVEALDEFSFLKNERDKGPAPERHRPAGGDKWKYDHGSFEHVKEEFKSRMEDRKKQGGGGAAAKSKSVDVQPRMPPYKSPSVTDGPDASKAEALRVDDELVDIKDDFVGADEDSFASQRWNIRFTLRSHYDSIRAMQFHPVEPVLVTASEDGTAKLWDLSGRMASGAEGKAPSAATATGIVDIEPIYTFRGHKGAILSMDMSPTGDMCYTGGLDGSICCWTIPSTAIEVYAPYDATVLQERLLGHTDCVWAVCLHSSSNRLISASADGTVRLWEQGVALEGMQSLVKTYAPPQPGQRPRSIDIVSTEPQQLLTAYSRSHCALMDLETGRSVLTFDLRAEGGEVGEINKVLSHPTMPVSVMAGEDRKIRYFDNNTGKLIHGGVAHVESISSLAIDPNGLYLLSGSHDGSLRLWNMEKRICLQEIAAHRKKYDMSVLAVAFHSSRPLIGSAGADGLAKVFDASAAGTSATIVRQPPAFVPAGAAAGAGAGPKAPIN